MAKITTPIQISKYFGTPESELNRLGVLNTTLNVDTELFIDPLLLARSAHKELRDARITYESYFRLVEGLLRGIRTENDVAWKAAFKHLSFPEVRGTCLGYGAGSTAGSGSGPGMARRLLATGQQIVAMGVEDPDLFAAMALFEKDFGPDLISDMTTNIIFSELADFNDRVTSALGLPGREFHISLANGKKYNRSFIENPLVNGTPLILVPMDVLRPLPVATSWRDVQAASEENDEFRQSLSQDVAEMWSRKTLENKDQLKRWAMTDKSMFEMLLEMLRGAEAKPYDFLSDPLGELIWRSIGEKIAKDEPLTIPKPAVTTQGVLDVTRTIIRRFAFLIEERRLSEELYYIGKPRPEKSAQRLFYSIADAYCNANNIDITPEAETGKGPVDFKFSTGKADRVLVEAKLSTNGKLLAGYEKQLAAYDTAEESMHSCYLILDVGGNGRNIKNVQDSRSARLAAGKRAPDIVVINARRTISASKLM